MSSSVLADKNRHGCACTWRMWRGASQHDQVRMPPANTAPHSRIPQSAHLTTNLRVFVGRGLERRLQGAESVTESLPSLVCQAARDSPPSFRAPAPRARCWFHKDLERSACNVVCKRPEAPLVCAWSRFGSTLRNIQRGSWTDDLLLMLFILGNFQRVVKSASFI